MPTVVISPFNVVNFPEGGGHFWVYMQYAQGLRQLGCNVYWLENFRSSGDAEQDAAVLSLYTARMEAYGLGGKVILYISRGQTGATGRPTEYIGMTPTARHLPRSPIGIRSTGSETVLRSTTTPSERRSCRSRSCQA